MIKLETRPNSSCNFLPKENPLLQSQITALANSTNTKMNSDNLQILNDAANQRNPIPLS
jgi:hypothetical protein